MLRNRAKLIDRTILIAANGDELEIHGVSRRYTLTEENYGAPPIEYIADRGVFQHGEMLQSVWLRPRPVQLVVRWSACSRSEYWSNRSDLLDIVRPNRGGSVAPMHIRKYLANGAVRQLDVVADSTPVFGPRDLNQWDEFAFTEALKFIAHDPTWYDPTLVEVSHATSALCTTFGSWPTFPVIRVTGPIANPVIANTETGESLTFTGLTLTGAQYMDIDLAYGHKTAVRDNGTNLLGYLTATSDLGTFHLAPDPESSGGDNHITLSGSGAYLTTGIRVRWYDRFFGI